MTKIAIITDLHIGARSDDNFVYKNMVSFYDMFFKYLDEKKIKSIINLGDTFDRRKMTNNKTLDAAKKDIFDNMNRFKVYSLIGNHDCFYRNTNRVNSAKTCLAEYSNMMFFEEPTEYMIEGLNFCLIPWINSENNREAMDLIASSNASVCLGHFEIAGFEFHKGSICRHGLSPKIFNKYKHTFSGHFHKKSKDGNIQYLGSPYQTTWNEYTEKKGFHIFDTETLELEFIENKNNLFIEFTPDEIPDMIEDKFCRLVVSESFTKTKDFDLLKEKLHSMKPARLSDKITDKVKHEESKSETEVNISDLDIISISKEYISKLQNFEQKEETQYLIEQLYREAC